MIDSLLSQNQKKKIVDAIKVKKYERVVSILESVKTAHAGTAKTKDKRFTIKAIIKHVKDTYKNPLAIEKTFFIIGNKFCKMDEGVAKQIGASLIWRAYRLNPKKVEHFLLKIADHSNWEVRESAGGAFANTLYNNDKFYLTLKKWTTHKSVNIRRAVVVGAFGLRERKKPADIKRAFKLLEPLLYDPAVYVKKNLGPFVLGSYYGNSYPNELFSQLNKWIKIKDPNVRWNVAMTFNNSFGHRYPKEAIRYLAVLSKDENPMVKRAVLSTLKHLRKRYKNLKIDKKQ